MSAVADADHRAAGGFLLVACVTVVLVLELRLTPERDIH